MIDLVSADTRCSRTVSLAAEGAYLPFRENGARDSHAMPLSRDTGKYHYALTGAPCLRAHTPCSAPSTVIQVFWSSETRIFYVRGVLNMKEAHGPALKP